VFSDAFSACPGRPVRSFLFFEPQGARPVRCYDGKTAVDYGLHDRSRTALRSAAGSLGRFLCWPSGGVALQGSLELPALGSESRYPFFLSTPHSGRVLHPTRSVAVIIFFVWVNGAFLSNLFVAWTLVRILGPGVSHRGLNAFPSESVVPSPPVSVLWRPTWRVAGFPFSLFLLSRPGYFYDPDPYELFFFGPCPFFLSVMGRFFPVEHCLCGLARVTSPRPQSKKSQPLLPGPPLLGNVFTP